MKILLAIVLLAGVNCYCYAQQFPGRNSSGSGYSADQLAFIPIESGVHKTVQGPEQAGSGVTITSDSAATASAVSETFVFSATRWIQPVRETPARITTIAKETGIISNAQTTADLLSATGEVFLQKDQPGGGNPMIRGFAANRVLVVVDGIRMNNAILRSSQHNSLTALDPLSVGRTEVLFGPASVIYGSDAIGGVIHFQTLAPAFSTDKKPHVTGNALTRFSSANLELTGHLDLNAGWEKWALLTSFSQSFFNDLRMGSHGPDEYQATFYTKWDGTRDQRIMNKNPLLQVPTGYRRTNLMEKICFRPNDNWEVNYGFHYSQSSDMPGYDMLQKTSDDGQPVYAEWNYGPRIWMLNNLNLRYNCAAEICDRFELKLAHQYFEEGLAERSFNSTQRHYRLEKVNAFSLNFDLVKVLNARHQLDYGLEIIFDNVRTEGTVNNIRSGQSVPCKIANPQSGWGSYGLYLDYHFRKSSNLNVEAGIRYNLYQLDAQFDTATYPLPYTSTSISNDALTASFGTVWRPGRDWSVSARLSTAFRAPNLDDVGRIVDPEDESFILPNPNLEAEYSYNGEITLAKTLFKVVRADITAYYTYLQDALIRQDFGLAGQDTLNCGDGGGNLQEVQHASHAYAAGFQAGIEADLPAGFRVSSALNFQRGEQIRDSGTASPLHYAAPCFGTTNVSWSHHSVQVMMYCNYSAKVSGDKLPQEERARAYLYARDDQGNPYAPAWCTINLKLSYAFSEKISVTGGIENITDARYRPYASGISAPGINCIVAVRASL